MREKGYSPIQIFEYLILRGTTIAQYKKELISNDPKTAWGNVSEKLCHGRDREDLRKVYLPGM